MDKVKNAGVVIFSVGVLVILFYFLYDIILVFIGDEVPIVIRVAIVLMFLGVLVIVGQLVVERMSESSNDKKMFGK